MAGKRFLGVAIVVPSVTSDPSNISGQMWYRSDIDKLSIKNLTAVVEIPKIVHVHKATSTSLVVAKTTLVTTTMPFGTWQFHAECYIGSTNTTAFSCELDFAGTATFTNLNSHMEDDQGNVQNTGFSQSAFGATMASPAVPTGRTYKCTFDGIVTVSVAGAITLAALGGTATGKTANPGPFIRAEQWG